MLLNRKKINRIVRWGAIMLAIVFGLGTVVLGVGSKTGNLFAGCAQSSSSSSQANDVNAQENYYLGKLDQDPQDKESMLALAGLYASDQVGRYQDAITYYQKYLQLDPQNVDLRVNTIARIYLDKLQDPTSAISVLNDAASIAPNNPAIFLELGVANKQASKNEAAILAWTKFLQLAPNDPNASLVQQQIAQLQAAPPPAATSTVPGTAGTATPSGNNPLTPLPLQPGS